MHCIQPYLCKPQSVQAAYYILLSLILNSVYIQAQLIINPGPNSTITCGVTEPCHIICNETEICMGSIWYVSNTITIECSGKLSCKNSTINTANITSLYALFSGEASFVQSQFISSSNDNNVTINCTALYACEISEFYHSADIVTHICSETSSCSHTLISSGYTNTFSLICNGKRSCSGVCDNFLETCSERCPVDVWDLTNPCPDSQIIIYSDNIYIECSDTKACASNPRSITSIDVYNFTSLDLVMSGQVSFQLSVLTTNSNKTNSTINTKCINSEGCDQAEMYYYGSSSIIQTCAYDLSCSYINIQAETTAMKALYCTAIQSCIYSTLTIKYGKNKILCSEYLSCEGVGIITSYTDSLHVIASAKSSFADGEIKSRYSDNNITIICDGEKSCENKVMYYNASGTVIHECNGKRACESTSIFAFVGVSILCNGSACHTWMNIMAPFNIDEFNRFRLTIIGSIVTNDEFKYENSGALHIYSLFGINPKQIVCIDCVFSAIVIIYGLQFNKVCWLQDGCLDNIMADIEHQPSDIHIINEYSDTNIANWTSYLDYASRNYTVQNHVMMVFAQMSDMAQSPQHILYPPKMVSELSWVSFMCLDGTCSSWSVDFRSVMNSVVTIVRDAERFGNIYAMGSNFILNQIGRTTSVNVYTNNTDYVQLNGLGNIEIHLGNVMNLDVLCESPFQRCYEADVYSTINPQTINMFKSGWNIHCAPNQCNIDCDEIGIYCNYIIDIHFISINTDCSYTDTDPGCTFLSLDPTLSPSNAPSYSPTDTPTFSPSITPTNSPSQPPTAAPTRFPTVHNAYSKKLRIDYTFSEINNDDIEIMMNEMDAIILIIEQSYVIMAKNYDELQYKDFEIRINNNYIKNGDNKLVTPTNIHYEETSKSTLINLVTRTVKFQNYTQFKFQQHYNNSNLLFSAIVIKDTNIISTSFNYVLAMLITIITLSVIISIIGYIFNKMGKTNVDNGNVMSLIMYAFQMCDFISDLNLSIEILTQFSNSSTTFKTPLYIAGYGSILFVLLPYMVNVLLICRIKKYVSNNKAAIVYFEQKSSLFVILVLCSGGAYASLELVSSSLFGLQILNCGLSKYELKRLSNLKLFGNVLLENLPQLICQLLYVAYLNTLTNNTLLSFFASTFSIIIAIIIWCIDRKSSESFVIQYDLEMIKKHKKVMDLSERKAILKKKECKERLRKMLASRLKISETFLELGYVTMTSTGFMVHVIHYQLKSELQRLLPTNKNSVDDYVYERIGKTFVKELYEKRRNAVSEAFVTHFKFKVGSFTVEYIDNNSLLGMVHNVGYEQIFDLGRKIKELLRENIDKQFIKNELINDGYTENDVISWLKLYKRDIGDDYEGKNVNEFKDNNNDTENMGNDVQIELQNVMNDKASPKNDENISSVIIAATTMHGQTSESETLIYNRLSTKL